MRIALLLALALLLAAAGCGSGGNSTGDQSPAGKTAPTATTPQKGGGSYNYP